MLVVGGNASPSAEDVTNALSQCGIDVDEERLNTLVAELAGKDLAELVALGKERLVSATAQAAVGVGGAAAAAPAAADAPAAKPPAPMLRKLMLSREAWTCSVEEEEAITKDRGP